MNIRPVRLGDGDQIVSLIDGVYREYGDRVCLDGAESDLRDVNQHYVDAGFPFVVLDTGDGQVAGTHAVVPLRDRPGICTFRRLYLKAELRGQGWGEQLMDWAIETARAMDLRRVEFWSDVRFTRAHRFFERCGFQRDGRVRDMDDGWEPYSEYFFYLDLIP